MRRVISFPFFSRVLTDLDVRFNDISGDAAQQLATAVLASLSLEIFGLVPLKELREDKLTKLDLSSKSLGDTEAIVVAELTKVSGVLKALDIGGFNDLGDEGARAIRDAVSGREGFELKIEEGEESEEESDEEGEESEEEV